jgi:flagellar biosynthesis GTPase FlhF
MRLEIIVSTVASIAIGLAASAQARNSAEVAQLLQTKQCQKCNLIAADVKDARQQRQEQRQELRQQRQEQRQELRQQRQEQRQELPPEVRLERLEQLQQLPVEVRQERQEQRQQRQDARQERRDDRQDARQERRDDRQDARRDRTDDWHRDTSLHLHGWDLNSRGYYSGWYFDPAPVLYGTPAPTYLVAPASPVSSIKVDLISLTQEQAIVVIENTDTKQELTFNSNQTRQTVYLAPGTHKLWFKNAKGSPWISGTLKLGNTDQIRLTFNPDKRQVQVYDDPNTWIEDRRS